MARMNAAVLFGNEDIRYVSCDIPEVLPGHVLLRVRAAGICGSDVPRVLQHGAHSYPIVLGHEFSGDIAALGEGVSGLSAGMRASGAPLIPCMRCVDCQRGHYALCRQYSFIGSRRPGAFADYVLLPAQNVVPFDQSIPYVVGALFEPSTVALHGLLQCSFAGGEDVAILGGGTIGQFAAQWCRILGARTVTLIDLLDSRLDLGGALGADAGVNTAQEGFLERALAQTGGRGFGAVFETAGAPATMRMAFSLAANKARVCFIGTPREELSFSPALWELMNRKEFSLTGSWMSYSAPFPGCEWEATAREFRTGRLRYDERLLHGVYPMWEAASAFAMYKTPGQVQGKIMLVN